VRTRRPARWWWFLLLGCGPQSSGSSTTTTTTSETTTSTGTTTTTSAEPVTTTLAPDLPPVDPEAVCADWCAAVAACHGNPVAPSCVGDCVAGFETFFGEACFAADVGRTACAALLPCDDLLGDKTGCFDAKWDYAAACGLCWTDVGFVDPDTCFWQDTCPGLDQIQRVECDEATCICTINGAFVASCPSQGCAEDGIPNGALACCP
jgi:hypothetical protein